jgi:single-stranded DNA-binding protein
MSQDTTMTIVGNLTADPELGYTNISREFAITEALLGWNPRVDGL